MSRLPRPPSEPESYWRRLWLGRGARLAGWRVLSPSRVGLRPLLPAVVAGLGSAGRQAHAGSALTWGEPPRYPADFTRFDYVQPDAPRGGRVILDAFGTFDKLNPFTIRGLSGAGVEMLLFETLGEASLDEPLSVYPLLAEDMTLAEDGRAVTFRLHPEARFSDGEPVLAGDVHHAFTTLTGRTAHPRYGQWFADVETVTVLGEREIRFAFRRYNHELHLILATQLPIFSRRWGGGAALDRITRDTPIGSGPYALERWSWGRSLHYRRRTDYWGEGLPTRRGMFNFGQIEFQYFRDELARLEGLKAGLFDWMMENSARNWVRGQTGPRFADGRLRRLLFPHRNVSGMQGFVMNLRRPLFRDVRVRQALSLAFDFDWMNVHLFYGQYVRCQSYFNNSPMQAQGLPEGAERALFDQLAVTVPPVVLDTEVPPVQPPDTTLRERLRQGLHLLEQAGWRVGADGVLRHDDGTGFTFELLSYSPSLERVAVPWLRNLQRYGIEVRLRTVDSALYQRRLDDFDFDVTSQVLPMSSTPGNELFQMFGSAAADQSSSDNLAGIRNPLVDAIIERLVLARDRDELTVAARALDRVLRHEWYVVPHFYLAVHRVTAAWNLRWPQQLPTHYDARSWMLKTWWLDPEARPRPPEHLEPQEVVSSGLPSRTALVPAPAADPLSAPAPHTEVP